jgi:protein-S-isoprenylcysteine O-methyltransferase Ste14
MITSIVSLPFTNTIDSPTVPPASALARPTRRKDTFERLRRPLSYAATLGLLASLWLVPGTVQPLVRNFESALGLTLVVAAVLGRLWCTVFIAGRKNAVLCADGPYGLSRNPLYVFSSLGLLGVLLATHRPLVALSAFAIFWVFHHFVIRGEESRLAGIFGEAFAAYRLRVPRIIPRFARPSSPERIDLHLRPMLRGFGEVIWFFAAWLGVLFIFGL